MPELPTNLTIVNDVTQVVQIGSAGPQGPAGAAGPEGPQGPPGPSGGATFEYEQMSASATWTIDHNLGRHPSVTIVDYSGNECIGSVQYTSTEQVVVTFTAPFGGWAYLN